MLRYLSLLLLVSPLFAADPTPTKLLIAFGSYRERPKHPNTFFYEHDGVGKGSVVGKITPVGGASAEGHPALSLNGRFCAFTYELENNTGRIHFWDRKENKHVEHPMMNTSPNAQMSPSMTNDGNLITFMAWNRPGAGQGWHVFLYDRAAAKLVDCPDLNSATAEDRMPTISGDGNWLGFASNRKDGVGLTDIYLYDRKASKTVALPKMNSKHLDAEPSMSGDGNLIAFISDRPGGVGGRDIYLYDRKAEALLPLPGLNTVGHEMTPSLSPCGRYLVFVSERLGGEGERDVYLYDREAKKLLPTPGLNSKTEDFDPCVIVVKGE